MEFLDDILNQQESSKQPQKKEPEVTQKPVSKETNPWQDLLEGITYEEPAEEARQPGGRPEGAMTPLQKVVLGGLGLAVLVVWVVVAFIISRGTAPGPPSTEAGAIADAAQEGAVGAPSVNEGTPTPTPTVTPTPTATPGASVFTRFDRQIEREPTNLELILQRGREYLAMGAYEAARGDFEKAIALNDAVPDAYAGLGWAHFYLWDWDKAEAAFDQALELQPNLIEAYYGLGRLSYLKGNYAAAAAAYDQAAEINPEDAEAEARLGIAAARQGDLDEAHGAVFRAMAQNDNLAIVYVAQSWARRIENPPDIDGAQGDLLYAQELAPNEFLTLNALAHFYVDFRPERLVEAEQLAIYARNWAENEIDKAVALQTLGRVYLEQGRLSEARGVLAEAAEMATVNDEILLADLAEDLAKAQE